MDAEGIDVYQKLYKILCSTGELKLKYPAIDSSCNWKSIKFTVDFTLLYCAVLQSSLGNWVLGYKVPN